MINSKRIEELNKKYEEYLNKFDEYREKMELISLKLHEIKQQLNNEFMYKDFKCIVKSKEISHKSLIAQDKRDNRRLYIFINNNLSIQDSQKELNYVINNMLPGVVNNVLDQEQLENKKAEIELNNLRFRGLDIKALENIFFNNETISLSELRTLSRMMSVILNEDEANTLSTVAGLTYTLGVMEGKRERSKGVVVID